MYGSLHGGGSPKAALAKGVAPRQADLAIDYLRIYITCLAQRQF